MLNMSSFFDWLSWSVSCHLLFIFSLFLFVKANIMPTRPIVHFFAAMVCVYVCVWRHRITQQRSHIVVTLKFISAVCPGWGKKKVCRIWPAATLHLASCCPEASVSLWITGYSETNTGDPGSTTGILKLKSVPTLGRPATTGRGRLWTATLKATELEAWMKHWEEVKWSGERTCSKNRLFFFSLRGPSSFFTLPHVIWTW